MLARSACLEVRWNEENYLNDQVNELFIYSLLYLLLLIFQNWSHEKRYQQITLTLLITAINNVSN